MAKDIVKKVALYRWRFIVGYSLLSLLFVAVLIFAMLYVPGGLTASERMSAVTSASLDLHNYKTLFHVDLPYLLLQKASISYLGLSLISIKLPSVILSFMTGIGLVVLLKNWFRPTTSLITTAIMLLSAQFLFISQQGNAAITTMFWSVYIMLFAYISVTKTSKWRYLYSVKLAALIALSLYTPLMLYVLLALAIGAILHPHMRYVIRKNGKQSVVISLAVAALFCLPLVYFSVMQPSILTPLLLGVNPITVDWLGNLSLIFYQLFDFMNLHNQPGSLTPVFSLPVFIIAAIGVYSLITQRHSVQSYVITTWIILVIPFYILNPTLNEIIFIPVSLLVAKGVSYILWYWYGLFPKNPYARIAGLIPVAVLVGSIVFVNSVRYFYTFTYSPQQMALISSDLQIVKDATKKSTNSPMLVVSQNELPFYSLYVSSNELPLAVTTNKLVVYDFAHRGSDVYATRDSDLAKSDVQPQRIIANSRIGSDSDRLYVYKNEVK